MTKPANKGIILPGKEQDLYSDIREIVVSARKTVSNNINSFLVATYFLIGMRIVEHEQKGEVKAEYGSELLKNLSEKLSSEFGRGFSLTNLKNMRQFYLSRSRISQTPSDQFPELQKSQTLSDQFLLSWSHYVFLMSVSDPTERQFYEIEAVNENWSLRELKRQFDSSLFERLALSKDKDGVKKLAAEGQTVDSHKDLIKDPYVLEFLGLEEKCRYSETDLENAIIDKLTDFLTELGKGFLFVSRQRRFTLEGEHYFVDLVFYNRLLRCFVLIDLKIGRITHEDIGQMQMYVNHYNRFEKTGDEQPTVGIILCKRNNEALVELTLPEDSQIYASEYRLYLPDKEELKQKLIEWENEFNG